MQSIKNDTSEAAGPAAQREEFTEGFFKYFDRIWELVNLRNDKQFYRDRLFVLDIYTFNEDVVREALLKGLVDKGEIRSIGGGKNTRYLLNK